MRFALSRCARPLAAVAALLAPAVAEAHVKWFCGPIDGSLPPAPLRDVVTPLFLAALAGFVLLVAVGSSVDALLARLLSVTVPGMRRAAWLAAVLLRVATAAYAVGLWQGIAVVPWADGSTTAILTPDLLGGGWALGWVQLVMAVLVLAPRLSLVAAGAILLLYVDGVRHVGAVYMIDYLFFPGIAAFLALSDPWLNRRYREIVRWRVPVLTLSISLSLMWTAVEKFLFPQWTIAVLLLHPHVAGGFALPTVTTIAGFVEFTLSFYLLVGREVLVRVSAVLLAAVFVLAMPTFGLLDVVGHLPLLAILLILVVDGETGLQRALRCSEQGAFASAGRVSVTFCGVLAGGMALYYVLHALSVWA